MRAVSHIPRLVGLTVATAGLMGAFAGSAEVDALGGTAEAASYEALSCDYAPIGGKDDAWAPFSTTDGGRVSGQNCPTGADFKRGFHVSMYSRNNNGSWIGHEFRTPPNTTLSKWEGKMLGYANGDDNHAYGLWSPKNQVLRYGTGGNSGYGVQPTGTAVEVALPAGTRSLAAAIGCGPARQCNRDPGSSSAENYMYAAKVTVEDPVNPILTETGGTQSDSTPEKGNSTFRFDAADNVGIKEARLLIDGVEKDREQFACDYSAALPCGNQVGKELSFDSKSVQDGTRNARVEILDAAGNTSSTERSIVVANADRNGTSPIFGNPGSGVGSGGGSGGGGSSSNSSESSDTSITNNTFNTTILAATAAMAEESSVTLKVSRRTVKNGKSVGFTGAVMTGARPFRGVIVALQAKVGSRWVTFKNTRTADNGAFGSRYRFRRTFRTRKYSFRAHVAKQVGYDVTRDSRFVRVKVKR